jgi:hypothetical protein
MSDYSEHGTEPVEDAAVADPPTEAEVRAAQERDYPEQAATAEHGDPREVIEQLGDDPGEAPQG